MIQARSITGKSSVLGSVVDVQMRKPIDERINKGNFPQQRDKGEVKKKRNDLKHVDEVTDNWCAGCKRSEKQHEGFDETYFCWREQPKRFQVSILVPRSFKNCPIQAGWPANCQEPSDQPVYKPGQACPVTRFPSVTAPVTPQSPTQWPPTFSTSAFNAVKIMNIRICTQKKYQDMQ